MEIAKVMSAEHTLHVFHPSVGRLYVVQFVSCGTERATVVFLAPLLLSHYCCVLEGRKLQLTSCTYPRRAKTCAGGCL